MITRAPLGKNIAHPVTVCTLHRQNQLNNKRYVFFFFQYKLPELANDESRSNDLLFFVHFYRIPHRAPLNQIVRPRSRLNSSESPGIAPPVVFEPINRIEQTIAGLRRAGSFSRICVTARQWGSINNYCNAADRKRGTHCCFFPNNTRPWENITHHELFIRDLTKIPIRYVQPCSRAAVQPRSVTQPQRVAAGRAVSIESVCLRRRFRCVSARRPGETFSQVFSRQWHSLEDDDGKRVALVRISLARNNKGASDLLLRTNNKQRAERSYHRARAEREMQSIVRGNKRNLLRRVGPIARRHTEAKRSERLPY